MKTYKHKVIYLNGNEEVFYCNGFVEAIVLAMAYAQQKAWDMRIKYITDEDGITIKDIQYPTFNIKPIKDSWSREEVIELLQNCWSESAINLANQINKEEFITFNKWIEGNL